MTMGLQMQKQGIVMLTRLIAFAVVLLAPRGAFAQTETVYYVHTDAIGSVRSITNQDQEEVARHDFLPFGEEWAGTSFSNISDNIRFAGLERDPETGLDYAMARHYRPQSGRFTQPDDASYSDSFDPQTTQLYGYVSNNPLRWVDPTGHEGECAPGMSACVSAPDPLRELERWAFQMWQFSERLGAQLASTVAENLASQSDRLMRLSECTGSASAECQELRSEQLSGLIPGGSVDTIFRKGLASNPFLGKTAKQIADMLIKRGFTPRGPNPVAGRGTFVNPLTRRGYHIDANHPAPKGPHVGVHRPREMRDSLPPRDYPIGR
jgi:RHS repeat-associated protein